jgi:hypothetical protein
MDSLSSDRSMGAGLDERMESAAQSLTALLKCTSSLIYAGENDAFVLEIRMSKNLWLS